MGEELVRTLADRLALEDRLILCDPVYFGGTVDRSRGSDWVVAELNRARPNKSVGSLGAMAEHIPLRVDAGRRLLSRPGDWIVVMVSRDDTLSSFAEELLAERRFEPAN
jgi:UDP-N-acetylmuramate--alanine ligase